MDVFTLFEIVSIMASMWSSCAQSVGQVLRVYFLANLIFPVVYMSVVVAMAFVKYIFFKVCPWPVMLFDL